MISASPHTDRPWRRRLAIPVYRDFLALNLFFGFGFLVSLATNALVARVIGVRHYGYFAIFNSILAVALIFNDFGINTSIVRYTAGEARSEDNWRYRAAGFWMKVVLGAAILALGALLVAPVIAKSYYRDNETAVIVRWALLAVLPASILGFFQAVFQSERRFSRYGLFGILPSTIRLACLAVLFAAMSTFALRDVILVTIAAQVIVAAVLVFGARRHLFPPPSAVNEESREMLAYSVWIFLPTCLSALIDQSGVLMLPIWKGPDDVGIYGAAYSLWLVYSAVLNTIATLLFPRVIGQEKGYYRQYVKWLVPYVVLALAGCAALALGSRVIIGTLFGPSYVDAAPALRVFSVTFFLRFLSVPFGVLIWTLDRPTVMVKFAIAQFVLAMALNAALIPRFGILGAAVAHLIVIGLSQALFTPYYAYRKVIC